MTLAGALSEYDGKRVEPLERFLRDNPAPDSSLLDELVELTLSSEPLTSNGASWLLRTLVEGGTALGPEGTRRLVDEAPGVDDSWTRLHLCHVFPRLDLQESQVRALGPLLEGWSRGPRPFLRAWATNALHDLSHRDPGLAPIAQAAAWR